MAYWKVHLFEFHLFVLPFNAVLTCELDELFVVALLCLICEHLNSLGFREKVAGGSTPTERIPGAVFLSRS